MSEVWSCAPVTLYSNNHVRHKTSSLCKRCEMVLSNDKTVYIVWYEWTIDTFYVEPVNSWRAPYCFTPTNPNPTPFPNTLPRPPLKGNIPQNSAASWSQALRQRGMMPASSLTNWCCAVRRQGDELKRFQSRWLFIDKKHAATRNCTSMLPILRYF